MPMLITNGLVFQSGKFIRKDIRIEDGKIVTVASSIRPDSGDERVDAQDLLVVPGLIDPHVHLREPGATYKEDFRTGTRAAIAGGFTCVMDMPNNKPPTTTKARLAEKIKLAKEKALCDVLFHFGGTDDNFSEVKKAAPNSMKIYMGHTTGDLFLRKPDSLERHFQSFPKDRRIVLDVWDSTGNERKDLKTSSGNLQNVISLAAGSKRQIHIAHVCRPQEVHEIERYKGCTTEVTPHHLFLSMKDLGKLGALAKVNPPLQPDESRRGMWDVLQKIDCIASDHAPHTLEDKETGAFGFPGLETTLALMLDAHKMGMLELGWAIDRMSSNVAEVFSLQGRGQIKKGFIGDITIIDQRKEWTVDRSELNTKCGWSPFDGWKLKGKAETVIKDGEIRYLEGEIVD